jgi:hypothetical protein
MVTEERTVQALLGCRLCHEQTWARVDAVFNKNDAGQYVGYSITADAVTAAWYNRHVTPFVHTFVA